MRLALIANPRSGTAPEPQALERLLSADGAELSTTPLEDLLGEDGEKALRGLFAGGMPDRIVVAGGDGSIGTAASIAADFELPLAVLPVGTANDFARALGLPLDLEEAAVIARRPGGRTRHAELGRTDGRPFVNAAAAGLSVAAARAADAHKSRLGPFAYAVGAVRAGITTRTLPCNVDCDGTRCFEGLAWQVVIGATGAFGGGSEIGGTDARDGLLDLAIVPAGSRAGLVRRAYGMRSGRLTAQDDVVHERAAVIDVELLSNEPGFNVDGEVDKLRHRRFELHPDGFEVVTG